MSSEDQFPPPGSVPSSPSPPPGPAPGGPVPPPGSGSAPWGPGPSPGFGPPPGFAAGAAHKPGALPLRPLRLGDMYDAAFKIIRYNPRATVGSAVLVAAVAMSVPVIIVAVLSATLDLTLDTTTTGFGAGFGTSEPASTSTADLAGFAAAYGSLAVGSFAQSIGLILVTGMIAHVTLAAAVGRRVSLGEAWQATHGRRWRLIGLALLVGLVVMVALTAYVLLWVVLVVASGDTLLLVLWGVLSVPAFVALLVWAWVRLNYLAVPALMLERTGVMAALRRSFSLTRRQFWRTFGIALLTLVIVQIASSLLTVPVSLLVGLSVLLPGLAEYGLLVTVVGQALGTVIASAFVSPFTAAVASLQYVDQRMRKEAFDVELMSRAGITGS